MERATYAIRGNHDHGVAQSIPVSGETGFRYLTRASRPSMWDALGPEERRYLLQLPVTQRCTIGGMRFLLVHATPRDPLDEYLLKDSSTWAKRLQNVDADIVCVGHTHMQFKLEINGTVVLNPGSVGLPRDGDPLRRLRDHRDGRIEMKRVAYPIEQTVARVEAMPWPRRAKDIMAHVLRVGRLPAPDGPEWCKPRGLGTADIEDDPDAD